MDNLKKGKTLDQIEVDIDKIVEIDRELSIEERLTLVELTNYAVIKKLFDAGALSQKELMKVVEIAVAVVDRKKRLEKWK